MQYTWCYKPHSSSNERFCYLSLAAKLSPNVSFQINVKCNYNCFPVSKALDFLFSIFVTNEKPFLSTGANFSLEVCTSSLLRCFSFPVDRAKFKHVRSLKLDSSEQLTFARSKVFRWTLCRKSATRPATNLNINVQKRKTLPSSLLSPDEGFLLKTLSQKRLKPEQDSSANNASKSRSHNERFLPKTVSVQ